MCFARARRGQDRQADLEQIALPSKGTYYYVDHDGRSTYEFNQEAIVKDAHQFLYPETETQEP